MKNPTISVIVPVYNTEKYLPRCIDSILAQTFTDFELLLIDDGSKDNSANICDEYAAKDQRVRVFHKQNGGVSSARNLGLDNASGEWVTFVDSDDWIDKFFLSIIDVDSLNADLIITAVSEEKELTSETYIKEMLMRRLPPQIWGKFFRRSVIKDALRLPYDIFWGEDLMNNVLIGFNLQKRIVLKKDVLYNYEINETSVSTNRTPSLAYEEHYLQVLKSKIGKDFIKYQDAYNYTALYIIEDLIVCKQKVNYDLPWIKEIIKWARTQPLTLRQKIVMSFRHNTLCSYLLAIERKLR